MAESNAKSADQTRNLASTNSSITLHHLTIVQHTLHSLVFFITGQSLSCNLAQETSNMPAPTWIPGSAFVGESLPKRKHKRDATLKRAQHVNSLPLANRPQEQTAAVPRRRHLQDAPSNDSPDRRISREDESARHGSGQGIAQDSGALPPSGRRDRTARWLENDPRAVRVEKDVVAAVRGQYT